MSRRSIPNTPTNIYFDSAAVKRYCDRNFKKIADECKPESEAKKRRRQNSGGGKFGPLIKRLKGRQQRQRPANSTPSPSDWIDDHCDFLMIKPGSPGRLSTDLMNMPEDLAQELGLAALEEAYSQAEAVLDQAVKRKLRNTGLKQLGTRIGSFLGGPKVGIAVNIAMSADGARDLSDAINSFPDLKQNAERALRQLENARSQIKEIQDVLDEYRDKTLTELASDAMYAIAELNDCIRARRCLLREFRQTNKPQVDRGQGCCPGQSGHHLLPSVMFAGCSSYNENNAPTICVEGSNNSHGSHGRIHRKLGDLLDEIRVNGQPIPANAPLTKDQAINAAVDSVKSIPPPVIM